MIEAQLSYIVFFLIFKCCNFLIRVYYRTLVAHKRVSYWGHRCTRRCRCHMTTLSHDNTSFLFDPFDINLSRLFGRERKENRACQVFGSHAPVSSFHLQGSFIRRKGPLPCCFPRHAPTGERERQCEKGNPGFGNQPDGKPVAGAAICV